MPRLFLLLIALAVLGACVATPRGSPPGTDRVVTPLPHGWRFLDGPAPVAAAQPGFDDGDWAPVALPHSWNALGVYTTEANPPQRKRQGEGWYRLTLDGAALPDRPRHYLQFDAVGNVADVWVNGRHVGRHAGAFSRFRFDVTDALVRAGPNLIAIRADNSKPAPGSPTEHVIPLLGDFFIHGGLYRPVSLVSVGDAHIDLLDHGSPGVFVRADEIGPDAATVRVRTKLRAPAGVTVATLLRDAAGREVARDVARSDGSAAIEQAIRLPAPRLWDGRRDPHLYTATVELRDGARLLDRVVERFGVRRFAIDPARGFVLNGRHLPLHGVSRHQDWLGQGWAIGRAEHERDMALIAEMGANSIRFAHYQHAEEWFDLSDEAGMTVWAELPFVNKVAFGDAAASPELIANARAQMIELIRQNYNHPSVVTWGTGNEVDIDLAFNRLGPRADARPLLDDLHVLSRAEDPSRPTVIADCCEATPGDKVAYLPVLTGHADLMGYNRYFGWYYGKPADLGPHLDMLRARHPTIPISVSEYGAGGALSQHSDDPEGGPISSGGRPHPEDYQAWFHERSWPQLRDRPYLWGNWIWNMFDFSTAPRREGDATDINDKGLVSFDRRTRKDAFYYYKAQWSADPVLHITQRRYTRRAYPVTDVRVYSNAPAARLSLNGRDLGERPCPERICVWPAVRLDAGANRLVAVAGDLRDAVDWDAPDAAAGLTINAGDLAGFTAADGHRTGSDAFFRGGEAHRIAGAEVERLSGVGDARLRSGYRTGRFNYAIPLPTGRWRVTLLFVEPTIRAPRRITVAAEGRMKLRAFDPRAAAGDVLRAVERSFDVTVDDGTLDLDFGDDAILSAITVRPAGRSVAP
ncbi:glycoside hydrolase family 2 TIM barrel-domain containing protein [Sphingomonas sp.]|uniref:glycoside hydrolase family 2 TIM barrel-domain containing protein n=1 Tax=Sphingomonas sp. TaxID=28214 RepID=UPI002DD64493|nr:glycoside hydrolase family 2 TIM barrel-domain containing protein [Sphingomonas sp.]